MLYNFINFKVYLFIVYVEVITIFKEIYQYMYFFSIQVIQVFKIKNYESNCYK